MNGTLQAVSKAPAATLQQQFEMNWTLLKEIHTCNEAILPTLIRFVSNQDLFFDQNLRAQLEQALELDWMIPALHARNAYLICKKQEKNLTKRELEKQMIQLQVHSYEPKLLVLKKEIEALVAPLVQLEQEIDVLKKVTTILRELPPEVEGDLALLRKQRELEQEKKLNATKEKNRSKTGSIIKEVQLETLFLQERGRISDHYLDFLNKQKKKDPSAFQGMETTLAQFHLISTTLHEELTIQYAEYRHQTGFYQRFSAFFKTHFIRLLKEKEQGLELEKKQFVGKQASYQDLVEQFQECQISQKKQQEQLELLTLAHFSFSVPLLFSLEECQTYLKEVSSVKEAMTIEEVEEIMNLVQSALQSEPQKIIS